MRRYPMPRRRPDPRRVVYLRPRRRRPRRRRRPFRWPVVLIPLLALFALWLAQGLKPAAGWRTVMFLLGIEDTVRFTQLAALGVLIIATVLIARVLRGRRQNASD